MEPKHIFNIFLNLLVWAGIISLILFIIDQFRPGIQFWLKIAGAVSLILVLIMILYEGIPIYHIFK